MSDALVSVAAGVRVSIVTLHKHPLSELGAVSTKHGKDTTQLLLQWVLAVGGKNTTLLVRSSAELHLNRNLEAGACLGAIA